MSHPKYRTNCFTEKNSYRNVNLLLPAELKFLCIYITHMHQEHNLNIFLVALYTHSLLQSAYLAT